MPLRPAAFSVPVLFAALATAQTPPPALKFDFGAPTPAPGYTQVLDTTMYSDDLGYGFEPGTQLTAVHRGGGDFVVALFITSDTPFYFSVKVPEESNYKVTVTLGDRQAASVTTVKAELRRLMLERVRLAPAQFETQSFIVNVRTPQIPGGAEVRLKDREECSGTSLTWIIFDMSSAYNHVLHMSTLRQLGVAALPPPHAR